MQYHPLTLLYRKPGLALTYLENIRLQFDNAFSGVPLPVKLLDIDSEFCFYIEKTHVEISHMERLKWLLAETWQPENLSSNSFLVMNDVNQSDDQLQISVEFGPRLNFTTAWSTITCSICESCGIHGIRRIERSRRILLTISTALKQSDLKNELNAFFSAIHDRMTEIRYEYPLEHFLPLDMPSNQVPLNPNSSILERTNIVEYIPILEKGITAMEEVNQRLGLAFDAWDIQYYYNLFANRFLRNPTTVEIFDISQSNSEHSRHWFFKGILNIEGQDQPESLMELVGKTLDANRTNSLIAFCDNSSAIKGFPTNSLLPNSPCEPSPYKLKKIDYDITFTAETHNFPTGVAPFPGAETGTGGRLRDGHATGRGSLTIAGTTGYSVGQLLIPGYKLPWEDSSLPYPTNLASPLDIIIGASNGASDYGNKFGEPVIVGYARSFGLNFPGCGERREFIKPIMFTGGIGQIDHRFIRKQMPEQGMIVVKIGGPAYRIGLGGGSASSLIQGENTQHLDFDAVQRGDAEMEQKLYRVIRACSDMGEGNPIVSIHDQGAGGNANVLKELVDPAGAKINLEKVLIGDSTLSPLEIWCAEYQENDALLIHERDAELFSSICHRESCPYSYVGKVTGDGRIVVSYNNASNKGGDECKLVDMPLGELLGKMPRKSFYSPAFIPLGKSLTLPKLDDQDLLPILDLVIRHLAVGSKRFLTTKVDRCVTGLIVQQPCVGPFHIPVADCGIVLQSHLGLSGSATSIGEQPIKGLINPAAMARLTVGEAMSNLALVLISGGYSNIKASGNWMWPAKLPGEADSILKACQAMSDVMIELGIAIDGGKDSLAMAAKSNHSADSGLVKCPGTLVVSLFAPVEDVNFHVNSSFRLPGRSKIVFLDMSNGQCRLGGSALAQTYQQIGTNSPDMDDPKLFSKMWQLVQKLLSEKLVLSGHDRSDGGLIVTILEMAISGNCGFDVEIPSEWPCYNEASLPSPDMEYERSVLGPLFAEELGIVLEIENEKLDIVMALMETEHISMKHIHLLGSTTVSKRAIIKNSNHLHLLDSSMDELWKSWEATSFELEKYQANRLTVRQEQENLTNRTAPRYDISFDLKPTPLDIMQLSAKPRVAIIREEGSNGDRELSASFYMAGFEPWDVTMSDLVSNRISLSDFKGIGFVGGFAYADVLDSGKGWAGVIQFNPSVYQQFDHFIQVRQDTFSLGVCNGCQLMALLGFVPYSSKDLRLESAQQPRFISNTSGRFECRFVTVKILPNPSIMLKDMANSTLGIWAAHGEGRIFFPDPKIHDQIMDQHLAPLRYVNDDGKITKEYPFNPNGSPDGIAALCSQNGRHLAMMPHSERTILPQNWPWKPYEWENGVYQKVSPWLKMFQSAYNWTIEHSK